jgi:hypothetical protein
MGADMTTNNKGRNGGDRATPKPYNDNTMIKPSRISRKHKRDWKGVRK